MMTSNADVAWGRLRATEKLVHQAENHRRLVARPAQLLVAQAERQLRIAATRGAYWRVVEILTKAALPTVGTISYLLMALVGLAYAQGYYYRFNGLQILSLFNTPDFLLSAFENVWVLMLALIAPLLLLLLLGLSLILLNYRRARIGAKNWRDARLVTLGAALFTVSVIVLPFFSFTLGSANSLKATTNPDWAAVSIRSESAESGNGWLAQDRTILLGTTSDFHIFFKCEHADEEVGSDGSEPHRPTSFRSLTTDTDSSLGRKALPNDKIDQHTRGCRNGVPIVIPTDNLASVELSPKPARLSLPETRGITEALDDLRVTVGNLGWTMNVESGEVVNIGSDKLVDAITKLEAAVVVLGQPGGVASEVVSAINEFGDIINKLKWSPDTMDRITALLEALQSLVGEGSDDGDIRVDADMSGVVAAINSMKQSLARHVEARVRVASCLEKIASIGPFPEGSHCPSGIDVDQEACKPLQGNEPANPLLDFTTKMLDHRPPAEVMLIGRVDWNALRNPQLDFYGSDGRLAQQRAEWVRDQLQGRAQEKQVMEALGSALLLRSGPLHLGSADASDRIVEVWACWGDRQRPN